MDWIRTTNRLACALALLAIVLRVVLPGLHTHGHHHAAAASDAATAVICSCGAVHPDGGGGGEPLAEHEDAEGAQGCHHCVACEIEAGTPCDCPPTCDWGGRADQFAGHLSRPSAQILVVSQVQLPQPRAPPSQQV